MAGGYIDAFGNEHNWRRDEGLNPVEIELQAREDALKQIPEALKVSFDDWDDGRIAAIIPKEHIGKAESASDGEVLWIWDEFRDEARLSLNRAGITYAVQARRKYVPTY